MKINSTPLYIGTSGYNHEDWKGSFAPQEIHNYDMLLYYAEKGFNFLELTFTFYRMPELDKIRQIVLRTGDKVRYSVRIPKDLIRNPDKDAEFEEFMKGISPMVDAGLLACVYADYHPTFSVGKKNQELIKTLRDRFEGIPFFAELHNRTWYKERIFSYFRDSDIGLTVIDMPDVKGFAPYYPINTNNSIYYKLYGKSPLWLTLDKKHLDYNYTDEQMNKFLSDMVQVSATAKEVFVSFANVANGKGPINAMRMMKLSEKYA